jgi:hypothetical protein
MWRRGVKNLNNVAIKVIFSPYVNIKLRMQKKFMYGEFIPSNRFNLCRIFKLFLEIIE